MGHFHFFGFHGGLWGLLILVAVLFYIFNDRGRQTHNGHHDGCSDHHHTHDHTHEGNHHKQDKAEDDTLKNLFDQ